MGKKRQFDEETVLNQLASHFWMHGYSATKVDQLSELTGLTKTSLYNAFGNKKVLFLTSINFYVDKSLKEMMGVLDKSLSLSVNMEKLLDETFRRVDKKTLSYGCFLTNSIVELNANELDLHDEVTALCRKVHDANLEFFSYYLEQNKILNTYSAEELTDYYMTFWQGLRVESRNDNAEAKIDNSIKIFLNFIKSIEK